MLYDINIILSSLNFFFSKFKALKVIYIILNLTLNSDPYFCYFKCNIDRGALTVFFVLHYYKYNIGEDILKKKKKNDKLKNKYDL